MSRSDTRIVVEDQSVTFRHQDSKKNESLIMLIYSNLKNLFPKRVWCGGVSPHRCAELWPMVIVLVVVIY